MMRSPLPRGALPCLLLGLSVLACRDRDARDGRERQERAQEDAEFLGQEVFDLVDQTEGYQTSRGRLARHLRDVGIDSLTPRTARWISLHRGKARITVAFRRSSGHVLAECSGTDAVLEELALEGAFRLDCRWIDGERDTIAVTRVPAE